ncbi:MULTISPECIES: hypothetical protein [Pseudescherichia]|uniref:hypothetical protein n=1 Tax=Pseudescherichia TaxID=2055880 RepID=UPI001EDE2A11|nr:MULTISPECIES: hypothetical protein [Pseudescherichia]
MLYHLKKTSVVMGLIFMGAAGNAVAGYQFSPPHCDYLSRSFPIILNISNAGKATFLYNIIYVLNEKEEVFPPASEANGAPVIHTNDSSQVKCLDTTCYAADYWTKPGHMGKVSQYSTIVKDADYRRSHIYSVSGALTSGRASSDVIVWIPSRNLRQLTIEVFNKDAQGGHNVNDGYTRPLLIQYQRSRHEAVAGDMVGSLHYRDVATPAITAQPHHKVGPAYLPENINMIDFSSLNVTLDGHQHAASHPGGVEPHAEVISYTEAPHSAHFSSADIKTVKAYISRCAVKR